MSRLFIILFIIMLANGDILKSQTVSSVDKWVEYIEELAFETEDEERIETLYNELSYLIDHPMDINTSSEEDLQRLPFISDQQVSDILKYRTRYGSMLSLYELKSIESLDIQSIELLLPFIYILEQKEEKIKMNATNLLKYGKHELSLRYDQCLQTKEGYKDITKEGMEQPLNKRYMGEPFYHSLRYSYNFDDHLQVGIVGEKDGGEPFFKKQHRGYDFYSAHILLKGEGLIKSLILGDYKASFGQGLIMSSDFIPGRSALVTQIERRTNGFRRHYSTNEQDFFRGGAATLNLDRVNVSFFYSYRKMDALLNGNTFTSIKTDGLHRLPLDWTKRKKLPMQTGGGNIRYNSLSISLGATFVYYSFGRYEWQPDPKPYNLYYFRGTNNFNVGVDYSWKTKGVKLFGETALSKSGAIASLNGLLITPTSYISFLALHRYYDKKYQAYYGNAFGQRSDVQSEQGLYLGFQCVPFPRWKISTYADLFRHPWFLYNVESPSSGKEYMTQIDYSSRKKFTSSFRYKYRKREKNKTIDESPLLSIHSYSQHRVRLRLAYSLIDYLICSSSFDGIAYIGEGEEMAKGVMLSQNVGWKPSSIPVEADAYFAWFHTDGYNCRISSYEKNILYAFNMPSFYGKGVRMAATLRWKINGALTLSAKIGHTLYNDRSEIGTGPEAIKGQTKTEIYSILSCKF